MVVGEAGKLWPLGFGGEVASLSNKTERRCFVLAAKGRPTLSQHLNEDAPNRPHINSRAVVGILEEEFGCPVPPSDYTGGQTHLLGKFVGKGCFDRVIVTCEAEVTEFYDSLSRH